MNDIACSRLSKAVCTSSRCWGRVQGGQLVRGLCQPPLYSPCYSWYGVLPSIAALSGIEQTVLHAITWSAIGYTAKQIVKTGSRPEHTAQVPLLSETVARNVMFRVI